MAKKEKKEKGEATPASKAVSSTAQVVPPRFLEKYQKQVVSALTKAQLEDRVLAEQDLIQVAVKLVPLSRTMKEQITHIRDWAFERAVPASPRASGR